MKLTHASVVCVLLTAGAAAAAERVRLVAQPDIAPRVAAFPRLALGEPQAARINKALDAADARVRIAIDECRSEIGISSTGGSLAGGSLDEGRILGWTRSVAIAMRGPRYLALVTDDYADCGGVYPNAGSFALTYDLRTGQPPNWSRLLPGSLVQKTATERAMDETPLGMAVSPALRSIYLDAVRKAAETVSPNCMEALRQMAGSFMLWPDAKRGGLMVQPSRLPHASAACGVPVLIGIDILRRQGVQPALLEAIASAHRTVASQARVR